MSQTVGELLASTLAAHGATQIFGIVGDALNPFTEAIRQDKRLSWLGVRHEEGAALAATGQAKLTGKLGVCAGTAGPAGFRRKSPRSVARCSFCRSTALVYSLKIEYCPLRVACCSLKTVSGLNRWYSPSRRHWYSPPVSSRRCAGPP